MPPPFDSRATICRQYPPRLTKGLVRGESQNSLGFWGAAEGEVDYVRVHMCSPVSRVPTARMDGCMQERAARVPEERMEVCIQERAVRWLAAEVRRLLQEVDRMASGKELRCAAVAVAAQDSDRGGAQEQRPGPRDEAVALGAAGQAAILRP